MHTARFVAYFAVLAVLATLPGCKKSAGPAAGPGQGSGGMNGQSRSKLEAERYAAGSGLSGGGMNGPSSAERTQPVTASPPLALPGPRPESAEQMLARVRRLQEPAREPRSPEEIVTSQRSALALCEKIQEMNPERSLRHATQIAWLQAVTQVARYDGPEATALLQPLEKLVDSIVGEDPQSESTAEAQFARILTHLYVHQESSADAPAFYGRLGDWATQFAERFPQNPRTAELLCTVARNAALDRQWSVAKELYRRVLELENNASRHLDEARSALRELESQQTPGAPAFLDPSALKK